ncbi:MAG: hypothetical protein HYS98_04130 [Deltaproteobacteria bacterium]|nr:hypothetical protein [Deltaproteobacteria bacterium]
MRIAVIIDNDRIARWQLAALNKINCCDQITILRCNNTKTKIRVFKNFLYYVLNLCSIQNSETKQISIRNTSKAINNIFTFDSEQIGQWQKLPDTIINLIRGEKIDVILKFGMNLLKVPPKEEMPCPILSFHHGNPSEFRGRPAGFHEMIQNRKKMGQVVQILSNTLDAGTVIAKGSTKIYPYSYRSTLKECFKNSPLLINIALNNIASTNKLPTYSKIGPLYVLPGNWLVIKFIIKLFYNLFKRALYGAFYEKRWKVSTISISNHNTNPDMFIHDLNSNPWITLPILPEYTFYADPFFYSESNDILVEGMNRKTGRGEILYLNLEGAQKISNSVYHYSYPASIIEQGKTYIIPEIMEWSKPKIYLLKNRKMTEVSTLRIAESPALIDPTFFWYNNTLYLFGNVEGIGPNALMLWHSDSLFGEFIQHCDSPIRISPKGSRMAGNLYSREDQLFRFGQNNTQDYGNGIFVFKINALSPSKYQETLIGNLKFDHCKGPHTLNFSKDQVVFDWYHDTFSPVAGVRRVYDRFIRS